MGIVRKAAPSMPTRAWLALVTLLLAPGGAEAGPPRPERLVGYGIVNHWHEVDPDVLAERLQHHGLNLTLIEYVPGDWRAGGPDPDVVVPVVRARLPGFVAAMRARDIWTFVTLVNANGAQQRAKDDAWFRNQLDFVRDAVGTDRVILQAVSEARGTPAELLKLEGWTRTVALEWPGEKSHYGFLLPGHHLDFHPCEVPVPAGSSPPVSWPVTTHTIVNTDCLEVIHYLNGWPAHGDPGRARHGPADPGRVRSYARHVLGTGVHFVYYGFQNLAVDEAALAGLTLGLLDAGVTVRASPGPARLLLSPPSGPHLGTQRLEVTLIVPGTTARASGTTAALDGADISAAAAACLVARPGVLIGAGHGWVFHCPGLTAAELGPGPHTLAIAVDLADGTRVTDVVTWDVLLNAEPPQPPAPLSGSSGPPGTVTVSPPSGTYAATQVLDLAIAVTGAVSLSVEGTVTLDGTDVTPVVRQCAVPGWSASGDLTLRCPRIPARLLGPGVHELAATLRVGGGPPRTHRVTWEILPAVD
jgi:hypothetical protein